MSGHPSDTGSNPVPATMKTRFRLGVVTKPEAGFSTPAQLTRTSSHRRSDQLQVTDGPTIGPSRSVTDKLLTGLLSFSRAQPELQ